MADRYCLCEQQGHHLQSNGTIDLEVDGGTTGLGIAKGNSGAKWSHQMKLYLIRLLKDHDARGFRTWNAWSKEAWKNILHQLNQKFDQDYRTVKELLDESSFGWDKDRKMVDAPDSVGASFRALGYSDMRFTLDEELEETNLDSPPHLSTHIQHVQAPPRSTQMGKHDIRCGKKQKRSSIDDFHEKYLKQKKEEIDRFAKCITTIEGLEGLYLGDMLMASDIFKCKENMGSFLVLFY
ncbi:hypothetical protein ZWY2020_031805 [Hordeum vulgare]|nr:hypothetical protein ZWY2020_031805 [Hordeum vulgare]